MNKKIRLAIALMAGFIILSLLTLNYYNRVKSPPGEAAFKADGLEITINYSRPSVRGRLIFGAAADGALQPYGSYWRLGANEATEITINQNITFNGVPLKAGTYRLYAVPGASTFSIGVNTALGKWGASEPDYQKDLFTTEVPVTFLDTPVEQMTINIEAGGEEAAMIIISWSDVQLNIPIGLN